MEHVLKVPDDYHLATGDGSTMDTTREREGGPKRTWRRSVGAELKELGLSRDTAGQVAGNTQKQRTRLAPYTHDNTKERESLKIEQDYY